MARLYPLTKPIRRGLRRFLRGKPEPVAPSANCGESEVAKTFEAHTGRSVSKWTHYLDLYDRHFSPYRGKQLAMLEIGVSHGGSLELWRKYFGENATIFGIDIDPACAERFDAPNQVRIGSQADPRFLKRVVEEMGRLDLVLDDGSHFGRHQWQSFRTLWPLLSTGGLYAIEDLHASYWIPFEGGYRRKDTGVALLKQLIDDMHGWYHRRRQVLAPAHEIGAIHAYDSIVFIEKARRSRTVSTARPRPMTV